MVGTQEQVLYLNPTIIFFIFNLMTIGWLPLSGMRWFRCVMNISIVFCKIKRLTDRIVSNTLTFAIMANPRCENGSKIPTSHKCSTPRAVPWHQVTRLGLTVDNYLQLPKQIWLHCAMTVLAWLLGVSVSPVFNLQKANARTPFTMNKDTNIKTQKQRHKCKDKSTKRQM